MYKALRFLVLGAILGVGLTWLTSDLTVRAEAPAGDIEEQNGLFTEIIEQELACEPGALVELVNGNGAVDVTAWDKPVVAVTARKHVRINQSFWQRLRGHSSSGSVDKAKAALDEIQVKTRASQDKIRIETVLPKHQSSISRWVEYEVQVPGDTCLDLRTSNGKVHVVSVNGEVVAETSNGQISLEDLGGMVHAETSNGAIVCKGGTGEVRLETSNGSITVKQPRLTKATPISCETSNGAILVALPDDASFQVDAKTSNGKLSSEFPVTLPAGDHNRNRMTGTVGVGGPPITLRTSNGGIRLSRL